jgi:hypothetical protein
LFDETESECVYLRKEAKSEYNREKEQKRLGVIGKEAKRE